MSFEPGGEHLKRLGTELRAVQDRANLTNREVGELGGISGAYVSLIHDAKRLPGLDVIERMAHACGAELEITIRRGKEIRSAGALSLPPKLSREDHRFLTELLDNAVEIKSEIERVVLLSLCESAKIRDQIKREDEG